MANLPPTGLHTDAISILTGMLPMVDMNDPSNRALKMVSISFNVCVLFFKVNSHF
jgi:hypothetical protein